MQNCMLVGLEEIVYEGVDCIHTCFLSRVLWWTFVKMGNVTWGSIKIWEFLYLLNVHCVVCQIVLEYDFHFHEISTQKMFHSNSRCVRTCSKTDVIPVPIICFHPRRKIHSLQEFQSWYLCFFKCSFGKAQIAYYKGIPSMDRSSHGSSLFRQSNSSAALAQKLMTLLTYNISLMMQ